MGILLTRKLGREHHLGLCLFSSCIRLFIPTLLILLRRKPFDVPGPFSSGGSRDYLKSDFVRLNHWPVAASKRR